MPQVRSVRHALLGLLFGVLLCSSMASSAHAAIDPGAAMTAPVYQRVNPTTTATLVTPWKNEADTASAQNGFSLDWGSPFTVALSPTTGLVAVQRLYHAANLDFTWAILGSAPYDQAKQNGYADQGTAFYALPAAAGTATQPVNVYVKGVHQRLAVAARAAERTAAGWTLQRVAFHVPAAPAQAPPPPTTNPAPRVLSSPGAAPIGSASYPAPTNAITVAPGGVDTNAGTPTAPVRTIARALALAPDGGTVVLRAGTYRETVTVSRPNVTLQNAPGEAAWLDGSTPVTGWVQDGTPWRRDGWTTRFGHSPTYTQGAPDSTQPHWQFINPAYPMALYPDQLFLDGVGQRQVARLDQVTAGTFYLDEATSRLYVGTSPVGRRVEASVLIEALSIRASGVRIRGIGVRAYSPSVFHMGSITVEATGVRLENMVVTSAATTGISVLSTNATLDRVTVSGSGMLGVHGRYADAW